MPLANWVSQRAGITIGANPIVNGGYRDTYQLTEPVTVETPDGPVIADEVIYNLGITGGWFEQEVTYDASTGFYGWLRHRVRLAPGQSQLHIQGLDFGGGTPVEEPPAHAVLRGDVQPGEVALGFAEIEGLNMYQEEEIPGISQHVAPDDLNPLLKELPPETVRSTPPPDTGDQ